MDGVHDLGGKQGFGPVRYASSRTAFKAEWEPRANALYSLGVRLGLINMDEYRHAIERMEPPLPVGELLRTVADRVRNPVRRKGYRLARGARTLCRGVISDLPAKRRGPAQCNTARVVCGW